MNTEEEDFPDIGKRRHGEVLVCHGDDRPDQFAGWLQPLANKFDWLSSIAAGYDIDMDPQDGSPPISDIMDFCQRLGIAFVSKPWDGYLISGTSRIGWIKIGTVRSASLLGENLIRALEGHMIGLVKAEVIHELQSINDLNEFLERTNDNRPALNFLDQKAATLNATLQATEAELKAATRRIVAFTESDTAEIDHACVCLASALLTSEKCRLRAGPLVLWDDGVVYAISSWGGSPIPPGSSPAILLDGLQKSSCSLVTVSESTIIGGLGGHPVYRRGPAQINGWANVWSLREKWQRTFVVTPPEFLEQVQKIHEFWAPPASG